MGVNLPTSQFNDLEIGRDPGEQKALF
jgi:hypothetical protein